MVGKGGAPDLQTQSLYDALANKLSQRQKRWGGSAALYDGSARVLMAQCSLNQAWTA